MAESNPQADSAAQAGPQDQAPHNIPGAVEMQDQGVANYFRNQLAKEGGYELPAAGSDSRQQPEQPQADTSSHPEKPAEATTDADAADQPDELDAQLDSDEEQPGDDDGPGIEIDGEYLTASQIRELRHEATEGGMRLEDYTRKTQIISRVRQEHEALGQVYDQQNQALGLQRDILLQAVDAQVAQFQNVDTSKLSQEQFQQFQVAFQNTKQGADAIHAAFDDAQQKLDRSRADAFQRQAKSTREMLRWHEPRWNQEFYGKLRQFAVSEGLMSEEAFNRENDFLRMAGVIALMDRANVDEIVTSRQTDTRPSKSTARAQARQRRRNARGQFQSAQQNVMQSTNAKRDGSLREMFKANLAAERGE